MYTVYRRDGDEGSFVAEYGELREAEIRAEEEWGECVVVPNVEKGHNPELVEVWCHQFL